MSEMIDRVARAMYAASRAKDYVPVPDGYVNEYDRRMARAAIEAMREPTVTMHRAAPFIERQGWAAMIDAALIDK